MTRHAPIAPQSVECWPTKLESPIGNVLMEFLEIKMDATVYSFHTFKNAKITVVAMAGFIRGTIIDTKVRLTPPPSINADSSISFGIPAKEVERIMLENARLKATYGTINAKYVLDRKSVV